MVKSSAYYDVTSKLARGEITDAKSLVDSVKNVVTAAEYLELLGNLAFYERRFQDAVEIYERAMEFDENYDAARYHYLVGIQCERSERYVDAFKRFQTAVEIEPSFVDTYVALGALLVRVGDFNGACTAFEDALKLEPDNPGNHHNLVTTLRMLAQDDPWTYEKRLSAAEARLELAKKHSPFPDPRYFW